MMTTTLPIVIITVSVPMLLLRLIGVIRTCVQDLTVSDVIGDTNATAVLIFFEVDQCLHARPICKLWKAILFLAPYWAWHPKLYSLYLYLQGVHVLVAISEAACR